MDREYFGRFVKTTLFVIVTTFAVFLARLYYIQIIKGQEYREASVSNRIRTLKLPAPRGIIHDRNGVVVVTNRPYYYVSVMPDTRNLDTKTLAVLLNVEEKRLLYRFRQGRMNHNEPIVLKELLSSAEVAKIEARRSDFSGLMIETNITRNYIYNKVGAHVIGYLGKPSQKQLEGVDDENMMPDTFVGQWGVEAIYDKQLRGTPGRKIIEVDALGRQQKVLGNIPPVKGEDITLSLDITLQEAAEESFGQRSGSLVALDPRNGEVLALVSLPSFDPNDFVVGIEPAKWAALNRDKKFPLMNRALQASYPPGSVFKTVVSIAGIEEGVIRPGYAIHCGGILHYGAWSYGCWKTHGGISFPLSLVSSCDIFYYETGKRLGIDTVAKYAKMLGLGGKTGLQLAGGMEKEGVIPSTAWKRKTLHAPWYLGETLVSSIGQGYVNITPVQSAVMVSMIANEGRMYPLTLVKTSGEVKPSRTTTIGRDTFVRVKEAMRGVVNEPQGTAHSATSKLVTISGKTGTAQVVKGRVKTETLKEEFRDHAWFVAFAPFEEPEIAMGIVVEHGGHGGSAAAPIAKNVIEAFIKGKQARADAKNKPQIP
jgi:penicillin-binding protein 2